MNNACLDDADDNAALGEEKWHPRCISETQLTAHLEDR